jgi:hypothetical protein
MERMFYQPQMLPQRGEGKGFLPFEEQVRGIFFGGGAVIMSIIAFIVSRIVPEKSIPILLFINGGLIIIDIIVTVFQANLSSEDIGDMGRTSVLL